MKEKGSYLAVANRKAALTGTELAELAEAAEKSSEIEEIEVKRTNVTFKATPEAIKALRDQFANRVIIEANQSIFPLD